IVSNARLDFPEPESPVMQMSAFRGSRTVMSLRLCSRAPWTTSSSAAIEKAIVPAERTFVQPLARSSHGVPGKVVAVRDTARRAAVATIVAGSIVVISLALWKLKLVLGLLFFAVIIASALRPGIEGLARRGVPRGIGLALHYLALVAVLDGALPALLGDRRAILAPCRVVRGARRDRPGDRTARGGRARRRRRLHGVDPDRRARRRLRARRAPARGLPRDAEAARRGRGALAAPRP